MTLTFDLENLYSNSHSCVEYLSNNLGPVTLVCVYRGVFSHGGWNGVTVRHLCHSTGSDNAQLNACIRGWSALE